jgi:hypothetical protein
MLGRSYRSTSSNRALDNGVASAQGALAGIERDHILGGAGIGGLLGGVGGWKLGKMDMADRAAARKALALYGVAGVGGVAGTGALGAHLAYKHDRGK